MVPLNLQNIGNCLIKTDEDVSPNPTQDVFYCNNQDSINHITVPPSETGPTISTNINYGGITHNTPATLYPWSQNAECIPFSQVPPSETEGTITTMINYGDIAPATLYPWDQHAEAMPFSQVAPSETDGTITTMINYEDVAPAILYPWDQHAEVIPFSQIPPSETEGTITTMINGDIDPASLYSWDQRAEVMPFSQEFQPSLVGNSSHTRIISSSDNMKIPSTQYENMEYSSISGVLPPIETLLPKFKLVQSRNNSHINSSIGNIEISPTLCEYTKRTSNDLLAPKQTPISGNHSIKSSRYISKRASSNFHLSKTIDRPYKVLKRKYKGKKKWHCTKCCYKSCSAHFLYRHVQSTHMPRECPYCEFTGPRRFLALESHIIKKHPQFIDVMCTSSEFNAHFSFTIGHHFCYFNEE